jgi:hypothetical protein
VGTIECVRDFCQAGGTVIAIGHLPEFAAGFANYQEKDQQVRAIVRELFGDVSETQPTVTRTFSKGKTILVRSQAKLPAILRGLMEPDFSLEKPTSTLLYLHRQRGDLDIYFVANNSDTPQSNTATFRVGQKIPECWNAETGDSRFTPTFQLDNDGVRIPFRLKPYESAFYIFRPGAELAHVTETNADGITWSGPGKVRCRLEHNGTCIIKTARAARKQQEHTVKDLPAPLEISGNWQVTFQAYRFPKLVKTLTTLRSWTDDPEIRHFSGTARYELEFEVPPNLLGAGRILRLDLGDVADASKVFMNSKPMGVAWKRPHQFDVTQAIRPGKNFLEVRVSNRLINAVGGMNKPAWVDKVVEKYGRYNARRAWYETNVVEYGATDLPAAGLLGPVLLVPVQEIEFSL